MPKKLFIKSFGCQMNEYDAGKIIDLMAETYGFVATENSEEADLIVLNTCSVREKAAEKIFSDLGRLRFLKKDKPDLILAVGGCVSQQEKENIFRRAPYVDIVFGPQTLHRLPKLYERACGKESKIIDTEHAQIEKFDYLPKPSRVGPVAYVSIMEGCNKYCSYCIVPYTRGVEVNRKMQDILDEVNILVDQGAKEIHLLGQNVNAYKDPDACTSLFGVKRRSNPLHDAPSSLRASAFHERGNLRHDAPSSLRASAFHERGNLLHDASSSLRASAFYERGNLRHDASSSLRASAFYERGNPLHDAPSSLRASAFYERGNLRHDASSSLRASAFYERGNLRHDERCIQEKIAARTSCARNDDDMVELSKHAKLSDLIREVARIDGVERIRFTTSHPREFGDDLIEIFRQEKKLVDHLHLPVQSGSDRILKLMRRGYTSEEFCNIIAKLRGVRPNISITSDFIVGFPGETEEDFLATMDMVSDINFDASYSFIYSPRPNTPAEKMEDNVSLVEKKERLAVLQNQLLSQARQLSKNMIGTVQKVLVTDHAKKNPKQFSGRTENNRVVNFSSPKDVMGEMAEVKITEALPNSLRGEKTI